MSKITLLVISISNPILVGVYKDNNLIDKFSLEGKTSDVLPKEVEKILNKYNLNKIYYVNGPGSYMAIKIAYIFLKTLSIVKQIEFKAAQGFYFNGDTPIKALGKKYFIKGEDGKILIDFLKNETVKGFQLPNILDESIFEDDTLPNYNLPAV